MRVFHLMAGARVGGAERFFERLLPALGQAGVTQAAAIRRHPERAAHLRAHGIVTTELRFGGPVDLITRWRVPGLVRAFAPDLVLAWMSRAADRMPQGSWVTAARLGGYYKLTHYRRCRHLIGNTEDIARYLRAEGHPADRVHVLPNFADPPGAGVVARSALATSEAAPVLLCLGRLHTNKAFDVALKALADLPEAILWLAGVGPEEAALRALADQLGVAARVRWLGWRDDTGPLLRAATVLLCPSRHEPLGNVVLEAWAAGTPVVAAASAGPASLIQDRVDGCLVPIDDAAALAQACRAVINDPAAAAALSQAGLARFASDFTATAVVARYVALFQRLCAEKT